MLHPLYCRSLANIAINLNGKFMPGIVSCDPIQIINYHLYSKVSISFLFCQCITVCAR